MSAITQDQMALPLDTSEASPGSQSDKSPLILTPNASLAQQLRRQRLLQRGHQSAPAASVYVLQSWLSQSVKADLPFATDSQLRFLWEQVITEQKDKNQDLQQLSPGYLASQALAAWRILKHWQINPDELAKAETGQLLSFRSWVIEFEKRLAAKKLSTLELEIELRLAKQLDQPAEQLDAQIEPCVQTYAFIDSLPPLWQQWLAHRFETIEALDYSRKTGSTEHHSSKSSPNKEPMLCALESADQELDAAMHWARSIFESDSRAHIVIIDTNLARNLKAITRRAQAVALTQEPQEHLSEALLPKLRFSRQQVLSDEGPIQTALTLLSLNEAQIPLAKARQISQSPLWGCYQDEYSTRANLDFSLCAMQCALISTSGFLDIIDSTNDDSPEATLGSRLGSRLTRAFANRRRNKLLSPLAWCDLFQKQLNELGCFDQFSDTQWQRWNDALAEFARLGSVSGDIDISLALRQLESCCSASAAKSASAAPGVTFLDTVEAAADYSHIWILGMDNMSWPGAPALSPLLPVSLQIQHQIPHSQPQMETELVKRLIERLKLAADHVVFSYSCFNDDLEQSPCALIAGLPEYLSEHLCPHESELTQTNQNAPQPLEWVDCSSAPNLPTGQREVRGGASLLKTMAVSPFEAFLQWRLGAYELDEPKIGLSALDRGNLVHNVLALVWKQLGDSRALQALDKAATDELCNAAADKELKRFQARNGWLQQSFAELETKRLSNLISDWLNFERNRSEFSVELTEEKLSANIAGLRFKMRLDRLDRLPGGELLLIDYKTGQSLSRKYWLDMPPAEPQLPLYALTLGSLPGADLPNRHLLPDALCFAKVRADKMEFMGIGTESIGAATIDGLKGIEAQPDWAGLIEGWKESLETLATNFINGDTRAFKTATGFGRSDPFAALHRFAEFDQLEDFRTRLAEPRKNTHINIEPGS